MTTKSGVAAVAVLLFAATPAFAERPPNQVLPGDIEEYQRVCAAERQAYGQEIEPAVLARGVASPGWAELADHWHSQYPLRAVSLSARIDIDMGLANLVVSGDIYGRTLSLRGVYLVVEQRRTLCAPSASGSRNIRDPVIAGEIRPDRWRP